MKKGTKFFPNKRENGDDVTESYKFPANRGIAIFKNFFGAGKRAGNALFDWVRWNGVGGYTTATKSQPFFSTISHGINEPETNCSPVI